MGFEQFLNEKKTTIVKQWFDLVVKTYPPDTQQFMKSQKDPFANPVGQNILTGLQQLFNEISKGVEREVVIPILDPIIRVRAVQDFSPSTAVAFILDLKIIVRNLLEGVSLDTVSPEDRIRFENRVDRLMLIGFDLYMTCREKVFSLKADNERTRVLKTFERAGLLDDDSKNAANSG